MFSLGSPAMSCPTLATGMLLRNRVPQNCMVYNHVFLSQNDKFHLLVSSHVHILSSKFRVPAMIWAHSTQLACFDSHVSAHKWTSQASLQGERLTCDSENRSLATVLLASPLSHLRIGKLPTCTSDLLLASRVVAGRVGVGWVGLGVATPTLWNVSCTCTPTCHAMLDSWLGVKWGGVGKPQTSIHSLTMCKWKMIKHDKSD